MICFICKNDFPLLTTLVVHYKVIHLLKTSSTYECIENQCTQIFPNLDSFKKHVTRKHAIDNVEDTVPKKLKVEKVDKCHEVINNAVISQISDQINNDNTPVIIDNNYVLQEGENKVPTIPSTIININNAINLIYQASINLTLSLHNNSNFTRKDVVNI